MRLPVGLQLTEENMRIESVRIRNFRSIVDEEVKFGSHTSLVGPNGAGKSAVLSALNIFFRDASNPTSVTVIKDEDFHNKDTSVPVEIAVTFSGLTEKAQADLAAYARHGKLTVTARAVWDDASRGAEVRQYGSRLVMQEFGKFFRADSDGAKVAELREIYEQICAEIPELPSASTKPAMTSALREFEEAHPERCELTESPDEFYGFTKGANRLAKHVQWVYVPAVKSAVDEEVEGRNTALGALLQRTVRSRVNFEGPIRDLRMKLEEEYQSLILAHQSHLKELAASLEKRLRDWAHPDVEVGLDWSYDETKGLQIQEPFAKTAIGEGTFRGGIARTGHGLQRSFIVAMLTEVASGSAEDQPTLILGMEEPELYQHPPQIRHLAAVLDELVEKGGQVILTTHSPYLVSGSGFERVRLAKKDTRTGATRIASYTAAELSKALADALEEAPVEPTDLLVRVEQVMLPSLTELFFCRLPILVEGHEDVAFISTRLHLRGEWSAFRRLGGHFVVCGGKTNLSRPAAIALGFGLPVFAVWDGDYKPNPGDGVEAAHRRDNACLLRLMGYPAESPWTPDAIWKPNLVMWSDELQGHVKRDIGEEWDGLRSEAKVRIGVKGKLSQKNALWIAALVELMAEKEMRSESLDRLCEAILAYGRTLHRAGQDA